MASNSTGTDGRRAPCLRRSMCPVLLLLLAGCAAAPVRKPPADWELAADDVELVVEDVVRDTLYVRAHGRTGTFAPPADPADPAPAAPKLSAVPAGAEAFVTAARGLRWRVGDGPWQGWDPGPGRPADAPAGPLFADHLEPFSVIDGVLVETPRFGPGQGRPRAVTLLGKEAKAPQGPGDVATPPPEPAGAIGPDAVANGRGIYALVASSRGVLALDLANESTRSFQRGAAVRPAISSDGLFAAASMGVAPRPARAAGAPTETIGLFEGPKPLAAFPIPARPKALYFAAGALFAALPDGTLWRHALDQPPRARPTRREEAIIHHRDGLLVGMREALEAGDLGRAGDLLAVLQDDGLVDLPDAEAQALATELNSKARPLFERAVAQAVDDGDHDLALALDRRLQLVDGQGAGVQGLRLPTLQLAVRLLAKAEVRPPDVDAMFTNHPEFERVERCRPAADRGPSTVCLELTLPPRPPGPRSGAVRAAAERLLSLRGACSDGGTVMLEGDPPVSTDECEAAPAVRQAAQAFAATVLAAGAIQLVVRTNAGTELPLSMRRPPPGPDGVAALVSGALAAEGAVERSASDAGARARRLKLLVWQADPGPELRAAVRADATLRPGWLARPQPLGAPDGG